MHSSLSKFLVGIPKIEIVNINKKNQVYLLLLIAEIEQVNNFVLKFFSLISTYCLKECQFNYLLYLQLKYLIKLLSNAQWLDYLWNNKSILSIVYN